MSLPPANESGNQPLGKYETKKVCAASAERRRVVLVVDDERLNRAILCKVLKDKGIDTLEAADGNEAIEAIRTQKLDLVLLDIEMPEKDGFDVLDTIRVEDGNKDVPIIMVTATEDSAVVVKAIEKGANDYLTKPVDAAVMIARINMHLQFQESKAALKSSEERYSLVARGTNDGVWDWDLESNEVYYSPRWISMFDIKEHVDNSPELWLGRIHSEDRQRVEADLEAHKSGLTPHFEAEMRMRHQDGSYRWTLCRGLAVWDDDGVANRMAGSLTDITEGKVADALTGLPNRVLFHERLKRCHSQKTRNENSQFALLYLDLDNFKLVNDSLGHESGDRLLVAIARRLESSLREADSFVCRLGGDEFAIIVENVRSEQDPIHVARRIISSVRSPISLGGNREVFASVSVGISRSSDGFTDAAEMLQAADTAMYRAKETGKSCFRVFDPAMKRDATKRLSLENELRRAIQRNELHLHYQPIVDLKSSQVIGFEALSRWDHPELGPISPAEFIPIAEETGLIVTLGEQILDKACGQLSAWQKFDPRFAEMQLSVNLSSIQIRDPAVVQHVTTTLKETKLSPSCLRLEVTESAIMENPKLGAITLSDLRKLGVTVSIDDFGTGYSSLAYIHQLSPDVVKIDRSFVDQITSSTDKATIVKAILALADGLNVAVVAEGVETQEQCALLLEMGCSYGQGFWFARPLSPEDLLKHMSVALPTEPLIPQVPLLESQASDPSFG